MVVIQFDMRRSPRCPDSQAQRYKACLDMISWADRNGIDVVGFSEHHNTGDGFLSSPLMMAMGAAQASERIGISVSALLLPLHDPICIAEDIAVLDLVSDGRFMTVVGLGYREAEYRTLGVDWTRRGKVMDEKLKLLLDALSGESFEVRGEPMRLNPAPQRQPQSLVFVGGNSSAAARRAARFGLMFAPPIDDPALEEAYQAECEAVGFKDGAVLFPNEPSLTQISEDPDRDWQDFGEFLLHDAKAYGDWKHPSRRAYAESSAVNLQELREEGKYAIITPEEAIERIRTKGSLNLSPLCGGLPITYGWKSLELFAAKVAPHIGA
jgi:alkanesulfonate monooxygenase SsuD/methylene tetrahydromethanopterin reductase-like flavin-dependent oxidoreductase (luciferase family)